ncbi:replicative DNA helicase [Paenibacillus pini]|uniref:Replicative DNA helicase n=1 Tax=Paenibacillus pini JCM 16418 TaxID=1236976 RepID=W7YE79_9BACL|nr:replicative DNA helicase [Paenibacillus pini]GAF06797.1 replicative DNA helicase [Paenibacillus pini JCM 16418]
MQSFIELNDIEIPNSAEAEIAVLGALFLENSGEAMETASVLSPDSFYNHTNQIIFEAAIELASASEPIDIVTLSTRLQLKKQLENIGGVQYLSILAKAVPSAADVQHYVNIVRDKHIRRQVIQSGIKQILDASENLEASNVISKMQVAASNLSDQAAPKQEFKRVRDLAMNEYEDLEERSMNPDNGGITGIPSGFTDLDAMTAGFQESDLIIVAARPSVGKTAFALNIAQNVAKNTNETVAIFSLEMSAEQLVKRMISAEGNIEASKMRTANLKTDDWEKASHAIGILGSSNIVIYDPSYITAQEILNQCRRLKKQEGLGMIVIDYLQLIAGSGKRGENRQQEVSEISRTLKRMARELEVPVIALSQLSRGVESRQDKRPMMSDLRESGSIEQDADIVAFLYRDDYYNADSEKKNLIEIIISKQRNGPVGMVELVFMKNFNKFVNYERGYATEVSPPKDAEKRQWA